MVGAQGTTAYRIVIGALILLAIWRPWRFPLSRANALKTRTLACLNLMFYMALRTRRWGSPSPSSSPPLALAVFSSRRAIDSLDRRAAAGLLLLIPTGQSVHDLDPVGLALRWARRCCGRCTSSSASAPAISTAVRRPRWA